MPAKIQNLAAPTVFVRDGVLFEPGYWRGSHGTVPLAVKVLITGAV